MEGHHSKTRLKLLALTMLMAMASCGKKVQITDYSVIPEPEYMVQKGRSYTLSSSTRLCFTNLGRNTPTAKYIANTLRRMHVRPAFIGSPESDCILFSLNTLRASFFLKILFARPPLPHIHIILSSH